MRDWLPDLSSAPGPKYLAIADAIERDVAEGVLAPGGRLPPQRLLSEMLGIDLTTVTRAYSEAKRRGLIGGEGRRGSFVLARPAGPAVEVSQPVETGMNAPPYLPDNLLGEAWRTATEILMMHGAAPLPFHYQPNGGMASVRAAGANLLRSRGIECAADTVVVTAGGQHGLHAIVSTAFRPGDAVAVAPFTYPGLLSLARRYGLRLVPVQSDERGIIPQALAQACRREKIDGIYVIPTNDNPTTVTMDQPRREEIAQVASSAGLIIIEDDAYGMLPEIPLAPVASFAPDRTFHICSMSKIISPGLRVAWVRAPDVGAAWRLAADLHETAIMAPPFNAAVVSVWLETDVFRRLVEGVQAEARLRQDIVAKILKGAAYRTQPYGYHFWLPVNARTDTAPIVDALRQYGLSLSPSDSFSADGAKKDPALRVSTGGVITHEGLRSGLALLGEMVIMDAPPKVSLV